MPKLTATVLSDCKAAGKCYPKGSQFEWDTNSPSDVQTLKEMCWANRLAPKESIEAQAAIDAAQKEANLLEKKDEPIKKVKT